MLMRWQTNSTAFQLYTVWCLNGTHSASTTTIQQPSNTNGFSPTTLLLPLSLTLSANNFALAFFPFVIVVPKHRWWYTLRHNPVACRFKYGQVWLMRQQNLQICSHLSQSIIPFSSSFFISLLFSVFCFLLPVVRSLWSVNYQPFMVWIWAYNCHLK